MIRQRQFDKRKTCSFLLLFLLWLSLIIITIINLNYVLFPSLSRCCRCRTRLYALNEHHDVYDKMKICFWNDLLSDLDLYIWSALAFCALPYQEFVIAIGKKTRRFGYNSGDFEWEFVVFKVNLRRGECIANLVEKLCLYSIPRFGTRELDPARDRFALLRYLLLRLRCTRYR